MADGKDLVVVNNGRKLTLTDVESFAADENGRLDVEDEDEVVATFREWDCAYWAKTLKSETGT